jgi:hypothetical protein
MRGDSYGGVALTSVSLGDSQMAPPSQSRCSSATSMMSSPDTELDAQHQKEKQVNTRDDGILSLFVIL